MKPPADAQLAAKSAAKAQRAAKRQSKRAGSAAAAAAEAASGGGFRRFVSPGGYEVLVGRNNKQNDELSLRAARPDDLWLHLRGRPGSHTLLRCTRSLRGRSRFRSDDQQSPIEC